MTNSDIWNEIVELFHDNLSKDEKIIQNDWEKMVLRNYLGFGKTDIDSQRRLRIGSTDKKIDIMLKKDGNEFCVIELKQHSHSKDSGGQAQLFSYLNQLKKIKLGILVCDKLYVYAFDYKLDDNEQAFVEIPFKEDDENGLAFACFFQKKDLDLDKIVDWVNEKHKERLDIERRREKEREIVEKIKSEITDDLIKNLLRHHFVNKFGCADSFFEQAYKEHIGMVPPPPNDFDFDDPPTPRQTTGLKVVLPKGQIIQEHKASETLCRAVRYTVDLYGSSKVLEVMRNNNIVCDKELLLKKGPHNHPKASSTPIGNGYYVNTHMNNDTKRDKLVKLGNALGLHWIVSVD